MTKKTPVVLLGLMFVCGAFAAGTDLPTGPNSPTDTPADTPSKPGKPGKPDDQTIIRRYSIFSTSTDWEAVTGLNLSEYKGTFAAPDKKLIGNKGLVLYYLDGFPCYGLGSWVRTWISPAGKADQHLRIACIYAPTEIKFAWRNATADAYEAATTGMLTCPVTSHGRDLTVRLTDCVRDEDWKDKR